MKRKIAIVLTALSIALCLVACGGQNDSTVSENPTGRIEDDRSTTQRDTRDSNQATSKHPENGNTSEAGSSNGGDFMDDMKDAANNAGNAIGDAGRGIGDAMTGQGAASSSGMTGTR